MTYEDVTPETFFQTLLKLYGPLFSGMRIIDFYGN
jgi:hypothetical protein